jgi:hypothetical protein
MSVLQSSKSLTQHIDDGKPPRLHELQTTVTQDCLVLSWPEGMNPIFNPFLRINKSSKIAVSTLVMSSCIQQIQTIALIS